jgi:hypothetical protein
LRLLAFALFILTSCQTHHGGKHRGLASDGQDYYFTENENLYKYNRQAFFRLIKDRNNFQYIPGNNKLENANYFKFAGEYLLTPEYYAKRSKEEVLKTLSVLFSLVTPLDFVEEKKVSRRNANTKPYGVVKSRENDLKVRRRVNSGLRLRLKLVFVMIQIMHKYQNDYPEVVSSENLKNLVLLTKYDSLSLIRRIALLAYLSFSNDEEASRSLATYVKERDGVLVFDASVSPGYGPRYEFKKAHSKQGELLFKVSFFANGIHPVESVSHKPCSDEFQTCFIKNEEYRLVTEDQRIEEAFKLIGDLLPEIEERIKTLKDPNSPEAKALLERQIEALDYEIGEARFELTNVDCGYEQGACMEIRERIHMLEKEKDEAIAKGSPTRYKEDLLLLSEKIKRMRLPLTSFRVKASNGVTVVLAHKNRDYAERWLKRIPNINLFEELKLLAAYKELGILSEVLNK